MRSTRCNTYLALAASAALLVAACSESPTSTEDDINPALLEGDSGIGLSTVGNSLPQGSASFTGPGGLRMDATAEEFIQQLTLADGTVLKTSGVSVRAVPDEAVLAAAISRLSFGAARTGALVFAGVGTYQLRSLPSFDFIDVVDVAIASVQYEIRGPVSYSTSGTFTIQSIDYFDDIYQCDLSHLRSIIADRCDYQLGLLRGVIEFAIPGEDGHDPVVQQRTQFALPIQRRTIIAHIE